MVASSGVEIVRRFIEAIDRGDSEGAFELVSPGAICVIPGSLPLRQSQSASDYAEVLGGVRRAFPSGLRWRIRETMVNGTTVIAVVDESGVHVSGKPYVNQHCLLFRVKEQVIVQIDDHFDTLALFKIWLPQGAMAAVSWS